MNNHEIADILYEIAFFLEMEGVPFKPIAYEKAAIMLEELEENISNIYAKKGAKGLKEIPGIGESIAQKIEEYLRTGKIAYHRKLKQKMPINIDELASVEGVGPKKIKTLYQKLKIKNVKDLERAAKNHEIAKLFGFGKKTEENILQGIKFLKRNKGRFLLSDALPIAQSIEESLKKLKEIKRISVAGSLRRKKKPSAT